MVDRNFKINDYEIRTQRGIKDFFRRNKNIDLKQIKIDNLENCCLMMGFDKKIDFKKAYKTLLLFFNSEIKGYKLSSFIKEVGSDNFCPNRYVKYLEYRKVNKLDSNSDKFWFLKFGENWEVFRNKLYDNRPNPYQPKYISKQMNISLEEAEKKVVEYKKNKNTSLEGFIKRHGKEKGEEKFKKFQETSKHTKESFIDKLGNIEGKKRWDEYIETKRKTSKRSVEYWIDKGYDYEQADELRKEFHRLNFNTSSVDYWMLKGLSQIDSEKKVKEIFEKKKIYFARASKESLVYFNELKTFFESINEKVRLGIENNSEFTIYDKVNSKLNFYDFCVPDLKIIIEYHGERYHPNPERLLKKEWDEWRCYRFIGKETEVTTLTADEKYKLDQQKKNLALDNGYSYLELWSSNSHEENWKKIKKFLKTKGINYEN